MLRTATVILRRMRSSAETLISYRSVSSSSSSDKSCRNILSLSKTERMEMFEKESLSNAETDIKNMPDFECLLHSLRFLDYIFKAGNKYRYEVPARYRILSRVLDFAENQVFRTKIYLRSESDDSNGNLTKHQVVSRVLDVIKRYTKVEPSKVTEESRFHEDLGLDESESKELKTALQVEFKLSIPDEESCKIDSCKFAIDYIYNHRMERLCMQHFRTKFAPEEQEAEFPIDVFYTRIYLRSKSCDDSNDDLTKYQVRSRVLDVTRRHPKVTPSEVTEESRFQEDLGLDESESEDIINALQLEFKLYIPEEEYCKIDSCKLAIDYIYNHRMERLCMQDFWKKYSPEEYQSDWTLLLEPRRLI